MDTISAAHRIVRRANLDSNARNSLLQTENFVEGFLRQMTLDEVENPFGATRSSFEILEAANTAKEWFERGLLLFYMALQTFERALSMPLELEQKASVMIVSTRLMEVATIRRT